MKTDRTSKCCLSRSALRQICAVGVNSVMNIVELHERINTCPGKTLHGLLSSHYSSRNVFSGNYAELMSVLAPLHDPSHSLPLFEHDATDTLTKVYDEVVRLLHNYVVSAKTLIAHTRNTMRDPSIRDDLHTVYQERVDATFAHCPLAVFMQNLRNYISHKGLPSTQIELTQTKA